MVLSAPPTQAPIEIGKVLLNRVGPGQWLSTEDLFVPPGYNGVAIEAIPEGAAANASMTILDSLSPGSGYSAVVDQNGIANGMVGPIKRNIGGVRPHVKAQIIVTAGLWTVTAALIAQPSISTTNLPGNVNISQYGGSAAGPTNPLDVRPTGTVAMSTADGAQVTLGAIADAGVLTNAAGTLSAKLRGLVALFAGVVNLTFGWLRVMPQPSKFNLVGTSVANTAQTVTQAAAGAGVRNYLTGLTVSWSGGAPAAGTNVQIKDGATVIWDEYIGQAGGAQGSNDFEFTSPLVSSPNAALSVTIAAAGAGITTKVSGQGTTGP